MADDVIRLSMRDSEAYTGVGFLHQMSVRDTYPCHTHDFFEFFYVLKGKAIHDINGEKLVLSQGTLVFIRPDDVHQYSFINSYDMELLSIGVSRDLIEQACYYLPLDLQELISPALPPQIIYEGSEQWMMMTNLMRIGEKARGTERRKYFMSLLPSLLYQMSATRPHQDAVLPAWLAKLLDAMEKPENFIAGLPCMIRLSGVTQEHLTRAFRRYVGLTPTAFINLKRINYSAQLLLSGDATILNVCYRCGFNHISYFYQVFEKTYHCTPKEFLRTQQGRA